MGGLVNEVGDDGIPHGKPGGRHVHRIVGEGAYQRIVAATASHGAQAALRVKDFKDQPGVVGQAAHHGEVQPDVAVQSAGFQVFQQDVIAFGGSGGRVLNKGHQVAAADVEGVQLARRVPRQT